MKRSTGMTRSHRSRLGILRGGAGAAAGAAIAVAAWAGTAVAAGGPYGGPPVLPTGGVPGGFRNVLTAVTVPPQGRDIEGKLGQDVVDVVVPKGAAPIGEQVIVTKANTGGISESELKSLPRVASHDHPIFALGVLFQRSDHPIANHKFVTIELTGKQFSRADYVVVYSPLAHAFIPAPKGHARVIDGHMVIRVEIGTEFAVLAP